MGNSVSGSTPTPLSTQVTKLDSLINKNTQYSKAIRETSHMGRKFSLGLSKIANHAAIAKTILSIYTSIDDKKIKNQVKQKIAENIESKKAGNWISLGKEMVKLLSPKKAEAAPASSGVPTPSRPEETPTSSISGEIPIPSEPVEVLTPAPHLQALIPHLTVAPQLDVEGHNETEGTIKIFTPNQFVDSLITDKSYKTSVSLRHQMNRDLIKRPEITINSSGEKQVLRFEGLEANPYENDTRPSTADNFNEVFPEEFKGKFTEKEQQHIVSLAMALATESSFSIVQGELLKITMENDQIYTLSAPEKKEDAYSQINIEGEHKTLETSITYQVKLVEPAGKVGSFTINYTYDLNQPDKLPVVTQKYQPYDNFIPIEDLHARRRAK